MRHFLCTYSLEPRIARVHVAVRIQLRFIQPTPASTSLTWSSSSFPRLQRFGCLHASGEYAYTLRWSVCVCVTSFSFERALSSSLKVTFTARKIVSLRMRVYVFFCDRIIGAKRFWREIRHSGALRLYNLEHALRCITCDDSHTGSFVSHVIVDTSCLLVGFCWSCGW